MGCISALCGANVETSNVDGLIVLPSLCQHPKQELGRFGMPLLAFSGQHSCHSRLAVAIYVAFNKYNRTRLQSTHREACRHLHLACKPFSVAIYRRSEYVLEHIT